VDLIPLATALAMDPKAKEMNKSRAYETLKSFRDGFIEVFVSLFYKYRMCWRMLEPVSSGGSISGANTPTAAAAAGLPANNNKPFELGLFLDITKQECQPFVQSFVRTLSFRKFLDVRLTISPDKLKEYHFDRLVEKTIRRKRNEMILMRSTKESAALGVARGTGRWHVRWVTAQNGILNVFKSKKHEKAKHIRQLMPGACRVIVPIIEANTSYYSLQLIFEIGCEASNNKPEVFYFRSEDKAERNKWAKLLSVHVMDAVVRERYDRFAA